MKVEKYQDAVRRIQRAFGRCNDQEEHDTLRAILTPDAPGMRTKGSIAREYRRCVRSVDVIGASLIDAVAGSQESYELYSRMLDRATSPKRPKPPRTKRRPPRTLHGAQAR
jgi:hypothetical protein